jgi:hypothetical protein
VADGTHSNFRACANKGDSPLEGEGQSPLFAQVPGQTLVQAVWKLATAWNTIRPAIKPEQSA